MFLGDIDILLDVGESGLSPRAKNVVAIGDIPRVSPSTCNAVNIYVEIRPLVEWAFNLHTTFRTRGLLGIDRLCHSRVGAGIKGVAIWLLYRACSSFNSSLPPRITSLLGVFLFLMKYTRTNKLKGLKEKRIELVPHF